MGISSLAFWPPIWRAASVLFVRGPSRKHFKAEGGSAPLHCQGFLWGSSSLGTNSSQNVLAAASNATALVASSIHHKPELIPFPGEGDCCALGQGSPETLPPCFFFKKRFESLTTPLFLSPPSQITISQTALVLSLWIYRSSTHKVVFGFHKVFQKCVSVTNETWLLCPGKIWFSIEVPPCLRFL